MQFVSNKKWFLRRFSIQTKSIKLGFDNLYIFPNKFGLYWILSCILIYILGTNLETNLTILISYLMMTILLINLFLTHFNLHGLEIYSNSQEISFAKSSLKYSVILKSKILRNNLILKFINDKNTKSLLIKKIEGEVTKYIHDSEKSRGIFYPDIIYGSSSAPMSLFNCWFYWKPQEKIIVAPKLKNNIKKVLYKNSENKGGVHSKNLGEEFSYLRKYRKGEKKSHIDWKSYAKTNKIFAKEFNNTNSNIKLLKLNSNYPLEESLEYLCYEINEQYISGNIYAVEMRKDIHIKPGSGYEHYKSCLALLAGYSE